MVIIVIGLLLLFFYHEKQTKDIEALIDAVNIGDIPRMKMLIESGVNPDGIAYDGLTPIVAATQRHQYEPINYLLSVGVDINKGDENHFTPLSYAALEGDEKMYDFLIQKGAKLKFRDQRDENYVLSHVKESKKKQLIEKVGEQLVKEKLNEN